nr:MAG TPA: hypothetical protein [Caudoviricetes sp.]
MKDKSATARTEVKNVFICKANNRSYTSKKRRRKKRK